MTATNGRFVSLSALVCGIVLTTGLSWTFAHGGDVARIHSCVNSKSGEINIIGATDSCKGNDESLDWNIQGPAGVPGQPGVSGFFVVSDTISTVPSGDQLILSVLCPAGLTAISGGARLSDDLDQTRDGGGVVVHSFPVGTPPYAWHASATNRMLSGDGIPATRLTVYAVCASIQ